MEQDAQPRDEQQSDWASSSNPEWDSSANPTEASPEEGGPKTPAGREMLVQLQQMIDTIATQATPVVRDVAAKAAELAAVAGKKAGPLAYRAAEVTDSLGQRMAARSKDFAADMRRSPEQTATSADSEAGTDASEATDAPPATETGQPFDTNSEGGSDLPPPTNSQPWG
jgi:hypothetical protein